MKDIRAVIRGNDADGQTEIFVMTESSVLNVSALANKGFKWLFACANGTAPEKCMCGASVETVTDIDEEPASVKYECGRLILRDYPEAEYAPCKNEGQ